MAGGSLKNVTSGLGPVIVTRRNRTPCVLALILLLALLGLAVILGALGFYYKSQLDAEENRDSQAYLRKLVKAVNDAPDAHWKAKFNKFGVRQKSYNFKYTKNTTAIKESVEHIKRFFESERMKAHLKELTDFPEADLPKEFDARLKWPYCPSISDVPNQGACGSCYAVASVGVASDRACIASNGSVRAIFSPEDVVGCCAVCGNCFGGDPLKALTYWVNDGLVTGGRDGCRPYSFDLECGVPCSPAAFPGSESRKTCIRRCQHIYYQNKYDDDKHYASIAYSMFPRTMSLNTEGDRVSLPTVIGHFNESAETPLTTDEIRTILRKEVFLHGPTTLAFPVTEEFLHYASGVFQPYPLEEFSKRIVYWHVVRIIGWGEDEKAGPYWLCVNSFGRHWGDNGLFKVNTAAMDEFGLEYETALV